MFGGSLDDITKARAAASAASVEVMSEDGVVAPPILASDLLLYPYQLYKLSLAGADAVSLVVGALPKKDLTYLIKIAASLKIQTLASVTSEVQLQALAELPKGAIAAVVVSNRELEDYSVDMTGDQALNLLRSSAMEKVREVHDIPVFAEGGVGAIERPPGSDENSPGSYLEELKHAGASGCIVGRGLVKDGMDSSEIVQLLQKQTVSASTSSS
uniref:indole-3-glycerol-phosphate synthase n=1 Tax=Entomoneis paludosa TaxID=265537 RepID=A0A7S3DV71_9STRA